MGISVTGQLEGLLYACGLGFWLGLYYEIFRTVRLLMPPTAKSCFFQDVFFCLSAALCTFFCFLAIADGRMYLYLFVGEITGFFVFYCTLGRVFHTVLAALLRWIAAAARILWRWLSAILRTVWRWISRPFSTVIRFLKRIVCRPFRFLRKKTQKNWKKRLFFKKSLEISERNIV